MFRIGRWEIRAPGVLAPMAGITDRPFRVLARSLPRNGWIGELERELYETERQPGAVWTVHPHVADR